MRYSAQVPRRPTRSQPPRAAQQPAEATGGRARQALLDRLGERVRGAREQAGLARRELGERSGLSMRFLAQLEAGGTNVSVARLADVAGALGTTAAALLADEERGVSGGRRRAKAALRSAIDGLLDGRSEAELRALRAWLEARFASANGPIIALLGVRGAGKSTVGQQLAERLDLPFYELDALIEEAAGLSLAEIFELHGEAYYRRVEREVLGAFLDATPAAVLATGGSLVSDGETFRLLRRRAVTIWLKARPEDHFERVLRQGDQRPMARRPHAMAELKALLAARERLYAAADREVDTSDLSIDAIVDAIVEGLARRTTAGRGGAR